MKISINVEKTFVKIQHPFMIKSLNKLHAERTYHNLIKAYNKPTINILFNDEKLKAFPLRAVTKKDAHSYHF